MTARGRSGRVSGGSSKQDKVVTIPRSQHPKQCAAGTRESIQASSGGEYAAYATLRRPHRQAQSREEGRTPLTCVRWFQERSFAVVVEGQDWRKGKEGVRGEGEAREWTAKAQQGGSAPAKISTDLALLCALHLSSVFSVLKVRCC